MTNISTRKITSKDFTLVHKELTKFIAKANPTTATFIIDELLSEAEQIMIIKRFGAVFMFSQLFTPYRVSQTLGISEPTASRIFTQYCDGRFNNLLSCIKPKEKNAFLSLLEDLISAQVSPKARARLMNRASRGL